MYLGMTEEDYSNALTQAQGTVSKRMKISGSNKAAIKKKDLVAYKLLNLYQESYKSWWDMSKEIEDCKDDRSLEKMRTSLTAKIDKRDNLRNCLVSYLDSIFPKD